MTPAFSKTTALNCAKIIGELYAKTIPPTINCQRTDTQVLIERMDDQGHYDIGFPGTASLKDWLTDAKIRKANWSTGKVHRGFLEAWTSVAAEIERRVPYGARLLIYGHSLGGALATLCAAELQFRYDIQAVYTFGSPRVGNGTFADDYELHLAARTFRVVNSGDPVPHVPFPIPTFTSGMYRHVRREFYLNADSGVSCEPSNLVHLNEIYQAMKTPALLLTAAKEHGIASYIQQLEALA